MTEKDLSFLSADFNRLLESISDGVLVLDDDWVYRLVNPALVGMLPASAEDLLGHSIEEVFPGTRESEFGQMCQRVFETGELGSNVQRWEYPDGRVSWYENRAHRVEHGLLVLSADITERKTAEENRLKLERQMQHTQKLESLGVLAGGIAHDFNNLLVGILGNVELARDDLSSASPVLSCLTGIETAAKRAADLARQMLAYSGRGRFQIQDLDVNELVEEMSRLLMVSRSKNVVLKYNFSPNLPAVRADATQMRQIIMNLVTNASEAIGTVSGVVSITTGAMDCDRAYLEALQLDREFPEGQYVFFEVSDTGSGMDQETVDRVFDPFFTTKFTGRGLGMSAVLGIIRGHEGAIKLYSEPGKGTTVKVLLPALEHGVVRRDTDPGGAHASWLGRGWVLLVDDDETVLSVGGRMLERIGFDVVGASDGREALALFKERPDHFDYVLLDLTMPHMDGEETFRELRRVSKTVQVVLSSGYNERDVTERFAGKGLAGFLAKPYTAADVERVFKAISSN